MPLLTEDELRERIERLAAIDRGSCSPGERQAAELIAAELRERGLRVRLEEERAHGTYWWPIGLPTALAALAGLRAPRTAALVAGAAAAAAVADDIRPVSRFVRRRLLPQRTTVNVVGELGPQDAEHTVLLVSHHDAAHAGIVFHPAIPRAWGRRFPKLLERSNTTPPTLWGAVAGPALVALGALTGSRRLRAAGTVLSAGYTAAMVDIGVRSVVPGANDNLTGVATLLSVAAALDGEAPSGLRVILLSTGSEESFMEGMYAFMERHGRELDPARTHVICVDTVGSPRLILLEGEGMLGIDDYPDDVKALVQACADEEGVELVRGLRFRNATDGVVALRAGYPSAMLGSVDAFKAPTEYHWPTDTPDRVHYATVAAAARLCLAVARRLADRQSAQPRQRATSAR